MSEKQKHLLDKTVNKIISRKFLVWIVATCVFAFTNHMPAREWVIISGLYIGGQTALDFVEKLYAGKASMSSIGTTIQALAAPKKKDENNKEPKIDTTGDTKTK